MTNDCSHDLWVSFSWLRDKQRVVRDEANQFTRVEVLLFGVLARGSVVAMHNEELLKMLKMKMVALKAKMVVLKAKMNLFVRYHFFSLEIYNH